MYKIMAFSLFLIFIAVPAFATAPGFDLIDMNDDGAISRHEATTAGITTELFMRFDFDENFKLSTDEYRALAMYHG